MKKLIIATLIFVSVSAGRASAQIDINDLDLKSLLGRAMNVTHGFAPKFSIGNISLPKIAKVGEVLGLKKNPDVMKYFNTFKTGRSIYKIASYAGGAAAIYGVIKKASDSAQSTSYKTALVGGLTTLATGVLVKLLTKAAAYKAVDIFNGIAARKIRDIFSIKPATNTIGVGVFAKL